MKENMRINECVVTSKYHWKDIVYSECLVGIKTHHLGSGTLQKNKTRFLSLRNLQSSWSHP